MEILSTGEKIKRARVYKGLTLKDMCGDKISVSKMSCIENNKIKAEPWILEFVSKKLDIDYEYLKKDVKDHLLENLNNVKLSSKINDYEELINNNLEYAEEYKYYDLAMEFMHLLFSKYLKEQNLQSLEEIQYKYYNIYEKVYSEENHKIYYIDMAKYLYISEEYLQSANYYNNVKKLIQESNEIEKNVEELCLIIYKEAYCYFILKMYKKSYDIIMELSDYVDDVNEDLLKAEIYSIMAFLSLRIGDNKFLDFEKKAFKFYKKNSLYKARAMNEYASIMLELGLESEGLEYIEKGLKICPKNDENSYVEYLINVCSNLLKNKYIDKAEDICEQALDMAIKLDNIKLIERAYYIKSLIFIEQGNECSAEMYMNLSLDFLVRFANKRVIYGRYLDMGKMYFKFKNTRDSLKYFNLAINLKDYI